MTEEFAIIKDRNRITIPKPVVERLRLEAGDILIFEETEDGLLVRKGKLVGVEA